MAELLVTGGAGFIGTNFVRHWLVHHPQDRLLVLDALTYAGSATNLAGLDHHPAFRFVQGDIRDYDLVCQLLRSERLDTLVHFAAESHVDRSIHGPDAFIDTNVLGTHALLKAAKTVWLDEQPGKPHRFHHVSTDEVYGSLGPDDPPFTETTPYAPNSPYSASKAASDHLVRAYHHTYGLSTTISNCSNNYGPYQFPEKLIPLLLVHILNSRPLPVYGDGLNVRDWLYVDDHVRGIEMILQQGQPGEVYNIGGNNEWKNIDIVHLICREMDRAFADTATLATRYPNAPQVAGRSAASLITFVRDRLGHDRRYAIDATKMARTMNYHPTERFETGLRKTIAWYLDNEAWWKAIMAK
ncbi:MAG: dTDP-glucose 4,6-dehydratase [Magnetococcus sp. DMHC-8]